MATGRKGASTRLQAIQAETLAEQGQAKRARPLASYFSAPGKARTPRAAAPKPGA